MADVSINYPAGSPILKDRVKQKALNEKGYSVLPSIQKNVLEELKSIYYMHHPNTPEGPIPGFYVSVHSECLEYKLSVQEAILKTLHNYFNETLSDYKCFVAAMQVKDAKAISALGIHQDWNIVDESEYSSYGLWIPLVDINSSNGAIYFLDGSHRIMPTYRHFTLPSIYSSVNEEIKQRLKPVYVRAGQPLLFNQAIIHFSPSNLSSEIRPSVVCTLTNIDANPIMYYPKDDMPSELNIYDVQADYLQYYDSFFRDAAVLPKSAMLRSAPPIKYDFTPLNTHAFNKLINEINCIQDEY